MMSEIRKLIDSDFDNSLELSQYAFQYKVAEKDKEKRKERIKDHEVWGEFEQGALTSKVHILPLSIFLGENEVKMGGVAGVATWPEYRRNGSVSRLLTKSLQSMKDKGQLISLLHPFDIHFYRRFGWELCFSYKKYSIVKSDLRFMQPAPVKIRRLHVNEDGTALNNIYESFAQKYNGMLKRNTAWWEHHVSSPGFQFAVYFNESDVATGYVLYKNADKLLDIKEYVFVNEEARRGLWNFICQHDSMVDKVEIVAPENDQLPFLISNPKIKIEIVPYFMARIVDIIGFLNVYPLQSHDEELVLHINDDHADWNNLSIKIRNGVVTQATENVKGVALNIQALTAILLASQTATFLYEADIIQGSLVEVALLDQLISKQSTGFLDFF
jgi:predicted acetyltransferase